MNSPRVKLAGLVLCLAATAVIQLLAAAQPIASEPYVWRNVVIGGGGFVTGIITHPNEKGLMYARTDVGGAYRWDTMLSLWIPITDWIGMSDVNLTGIESIAVDPSDASRVYLAAGTYSRDSAAILCSADRGKTFARTDVLFKMGGNEAGRFNGERLAVDPNDGKILFFGSRRDGLWRSGDRGVTWKKVESFPNIATNRPLTATTNAPGFRRRFSFGQQPVGIVCVIFDPNSGKPGLPTPTIYAAASTTATNLFHSFNGGKTWQAVKDQPIGLCPNHIVRASDGMIYASYGKEPGPNTMTDGAVWKYCPTNGLWKDITPLKPPDGEQRFGYGAVNVDPQHPNVIMTTTFARWQPMDELFRSIDGGANWEPVLPRAVWNHANAPYTRMHKPHWMGDVEINPANSNHVMFTTGYGIWSCNDITAADARQPTHWEFFNHGLEETVPLGLISPPEGPHLLSALGDQDGFRHDDLTESPEHGAYAGPRYSNTEGIAYAGRNPQIVVRIGTGGEGVHAAISSDGGAKWKALAGEPPNSAGAGSIALSADGETIVWSPRRGAAFCSTNQGLNWTACGGLEPGLNVIADDVNPSRFYAYNTTSGELFISTNGAMTFTAQTLNLVKAENYEGGFGGSGGFGAVLYAAPECEGDLWLAVRAGGLYHSKDSGGHFTKLGGVQEAYSVGFGKAASGKDCSALYIAGKISGVQGLFRSDDAGENWVRINDDQHQFGWINHVTGDPRIYGRVYFATGGRGIIYGGPAANQLGLIKGK